MFIYINKNKGYVLDINGYKGYIFMLSEPMIIFLIGI